MFEHLRALKKDLQLALRRRNQAPQIDRLVLPLAERGNVFVDARSSDAASGYPAGYSPWPPRALPLFRTYWFKTCALSLRWTEEDVVEVSALRRHFGQLNYPAVHFWRIDPWDDWESLKHGVEQGAAWCVKEAQAGQDPA